MSDHLDNLTDDQRSEITDFLVKERDSNQQVINEARHYHAERQANSGEQYLNFITKVAELSLLIGAAIGPVIIATRADIGQPIFVFLAVVIYLGNGVLAIWKAKDIVEKQLDSFAPETLHGFESDVLPLNLAINKLIWKSDNRDYVDEYLEKKFSFLENNAESKIIKKPVNFWLDIFAANFVWASLLLLRTLWPFSPNSYWISFAVLTLVMLLLINASYIQARERVIKNQSNTEKLNALKREHVEWQKREVFRK